jgi:hypothetical protein
MMLEIPCFGTFWMKQLALGDEQSAGLRDFNGAGSSQVCVDNLSASLDRHNGKCRLGKGKIPIFFGTNHEWCDTDTRLLRANHLHLEYDGLRQGDSVGTVTGDLSDQLFTGGQAEYRDITDLYLLLNLGNEHEKCPSEMLPF